MCACGRHHRQTQSFSPLSQPPLCPGVLHGLGGGAQVGALCFVRLSLYCTSLLSLSWFSSLLLENGIDLLKITRSQHQPPSSSDPAPGPSRPTALCPPSGPWVPLHTCCPDGGGIVLGRALPAHPLLALSLLHVRGHGSLAGLSAHTVVTLMTSSRLPPCGVRCS